MALGNYFKIVNNSTSTIAVQSSGTNAITTMPANSTIIVTIIDTTLTTAAAWELEYSGFPGVSGTNNAVLTTSPTITTPVIDSPQASSATSTTTTTLYNNVTTGYILIGEGVSSGRVNIANNTAFSGGQVNIANGAGGANKTISIGNNGTGGTTAITLGSNAGSTSTVTINGTLAATTQTATTINGTATSTAMTLGGNTTSGSVSLANGTTFAGTVNVAAGAGTVNKTINIGTASTSGTTAVTIGSSSGATSTVTVNGLTATNAALTSPSVYLSVNNQTGTTFTPALSDAASIVTLNNASAIAVTIPTNASVAYPVGAKLNFVWITGAGQPTISAVTPGTTTIISTGATAASPKLRAVNSAATCIKIATDTWLVSGDIS